MLYYIRYIRFTFLAYGSYWLWYIFTHPFSFPPSIVYFHNSKEPISLILKNKRKYIIDVRDGIHNVTLINLLLTEEFWHGKNIYSRHIKLLSVLVYNITRNIMGVRVRTCICSCAYTYVCVCVRVCVRVCVWGFGVRGTLSFCVSPYSSSSTKVFRTFKEV